jgi:hypothetical protein
VEATTDPDGYLLATYTARDVAPFVLRTGRAVFTFGGFIGRDAMVDLEGFVEVVETDQLRYVLGLPEQEPKTARWIRQHCWVVDVPGTTSPGASSNRRPPGIQNQVLFDCRLPE